VDTGRAAAGDVAAEVDEPLEPLLLELPPLEVLPLELLPPELLPLDDDRLVVEAAAVDKVVPEVDDTDTDALEAGRGGSAPPTWRESTDDEPAAAADGATVAGVDALAGTAPSSVVDADNNVEGVVVVVDSLTVDTALEADGSASHSGGALLTSLVRSASTMEIVHAAAAPTGTNASNPSKAPLRRSRGRIGEAGDEPSTSRKPTARRGWLGSFKSTSVRRPPRVGSVVIAPPCQGSPSVASGPWS
jgi:hypothetical protein